MLSASLSAPSWSSTRWYETQNSQVFGTNFVLTCDGFRNHSQVDWDESGFSLDFWGIVENQNGQLIRSQEESDLLKHAHQSGLHWNALGSKFYFGNVTVLLYSADVFMMVFNTEIPHQKTHPDYQRSGGDFAQNLTRCATSSQISKTVSSSLKRISDCGGDMKEDTWMNFRKKLGKSYD